jgi:uridine monophosphate synthetase
VGLVVGATDVSALSRVRFCAPELWILAPGVGAQGADLRECVLAGIRADRMGLLVAVSRYDAVQAETEAHRMYRGVYTADPAQSARELKDDINRIRCAQSRLERTQM